MIIYLFGIMDFLSGILLVLASFNFHIWSFSWIFAIYLIIKGLIFIKSFTSLIDIICGILIILAIFDIVNFLTWIAAFWLFQKSFFSFL